MKGLAFYTEESGIMTRFLPTDPSKRDPGNARESFSDFAQLITRFPNSPYSADGRARMIYLRNLLADYEIHVANFYIERQAFLSALNRAKYVVENYQEAPAVPRAMEIMTEMYLRLGLNDLADSSLSILKENYPASDKIFWFIGVEQTRYRPCTYSATRKYRCCFWFPGPYRDTDARRKVFT